MTQSSRISPSLAFKSVFLSASKFKSSVKNWLLGWQEQGHREKWETPMAFIAGTCFTFSALDLIYISYIRLLHDLWFILEKHRFCLVTPRSYSYWISTTPLPSVTRSPAGPCGSGCCDAQRGRGPLAGIVPVCLSQLCMRCTPMIQWQDDAAGWQQRVLAGSSTVLWWRICYFLSSLDWYPDMGRNLQVTVNIGECNIPHLGNNHI